MRNAHFYLKITPEELLEYYQGHKKFVRVRTYEGYSIQFRADHLRKWVKAYGINGEFEIRFDEHNKFAGLFLYRDYGEKQESNVSSPTTSSSQKDSHPSSTPKPHPQQRRRGFKTSI